MFCECPKISIDRFISFKFETDEIKIRHEGRKTDLQQVDSSASATLKIGWSQMHNEIDCEDTRERVLRTKVGVVHGRCISELQVLHHIRVAFVCHSILAQDIAHNHFIPCARNECVTRSTACVFHHTQQKYKSECLYFISKVPYKTCDMYLDLHMKCER